MAYEQGNEYQMRIVGKDATEELSAWMNSVEQVSQALILARMQKGINKPDEYGEILKLLSRHGFYAITSLYFRHGQRPPWHSKAHSGRNPLLATKLRISPSMMSLRRNRAPRSFCRRRNNLRGSIMRQRV